MQGRAPLFANIGKNNSAEEKSAASSTPFIPPSIRIQAERLKGSTLRRTGQAAAFHFQRHKVYKFLHVINSSLRGSLQHRPLIASTKKANEMARTGSKRWIQTGGLASVTIWTATWFKNFTPQGVGHDRFSS
ncbi:MAG: hypothetical protein P4L55_21855 [Syntrophobacteraceae bacterium]|nr:hypothetical protein [Syntrophobacteraceae bacterium]